MFQKILSSKVASGLVASLAIALFGVVVTYAATIVTTRSGASAGFAYTEAYDPDWLDEACASSTSWTDVPNLSHTFTQGGILANDPVLVTLNSELSGSGFLRVLVDGTAQSGSAASTYIPGSDLAYSRNFATNNVASGQHTVKFQWRLISENDVLCMKNRSMTVFHRVTL